MDVYKIKGRSLKQVESRPFEKEIEIQTLVEENLEEIFGLELVATELSVGDYRLDTLAFDVESSSFVIIEYKRGRSYSVIDQGYAYLSTMLQKKADLILEYNEKNEATLKRGDVDWDASRVIFVSPSFNSHQRNSVNFKDVPFELWEIKRFSDDMVVLSQHRATSKESIIESPTSKQSGSISPGGNLAGKVKVYTADDKRNKTNAESRKLWDAIVEYFDNLEDTRSKIARDYISILKGKKTVCYVEFQKKQLLIKIPRGKEKLDGSLSRNFFTLKNSRGLAKEREWTWKNGDKGKVYWVQAGDTSNVEDVLYLLKQKYDAL